MRTEERTKCYRLPIHQKLIHFLVCECWSPPKKQNPLTHKLSSSVRHREKVLFVTVRRKKNAILQFIKGFETPLPRGLQNKNLKCIELKNIAKIFNIRLVAVVVVVFAYNKNRKKYYNVVQVQRHRKRRCRSHCRSFKCLLSCIRASDPSLVNGNLTLSESTTLAAATASHCHRSCHNFCG